MTKQNTDERRIAVVGAGIAGLTAAAYLARAGVGVTVFEKSNQLGGRARTQTKNGFHFNLGPHALYKSGPALPILDELGVEIRGSEPALDGYALRDGRLYALPATPLAILTTDLLSIGDKVELFRTMAGLQRLDTDALQDVTVDAWLNDASSRPAIREFIRAVVRLSTYADAPELQSAGAALAQVKSGIEDNVLYLDGGWQTLVDGLRQAASDAGAHIVTGARAEAIVVDERSVAAGVRFADGTTHTADAVLIAADPTTAATLFDDQRAPTLRDAANAALPVRAACLDVGLARLPNPDGTFALGIDAPLYFSVHSTIADLAAAGGATIHVAKYLPPHHDADPDTDARELETVLDLVQPGWRDVLVERRFLPRLTVANAVTTAAQGGLRGRPTPAVRDIDGLYIAGDWIGDEGLLSNASFASARRAAELILDMLSERSEHLSSMAA